MKAIVVAISILLFSSLLTAQKLDMLSFSSGITRSHGNGVGIASEYQTEIAEKVFFIAGTGYFRWIDTEGNLDLAKPRTEVVFAGQRQYFIPFNVGLKYYFGDKTLKPFLTACWALNITKIDLHKYYPNINIDYPTPGNEKVDERTLTEVTYCFGIGALYKISEYFSAQFEFSPYLGGDYAHGVRFMIGAVYNI